MISFYEYLRNLPKLHSWDGGKTWNTGGFEVRHLRAMHELTTRFFPHGGDIIETGAGNSTVTFLLSGPGKLTSVCTTQSTLDGVASYCLTNDVPTDCFEPVCGRSEWVLNDIARSDRRFDIALIDGGHGWPTVFVDFFHLNYMLTQGGFIILDDLQLHSINELGRLLFNERAKFELVQKIDKVAIFQKGTDDRYAGDWFEQTYIREMSERIASNATRFDLSY